MDTVDAAGHRIAYERNGKGPPVVLLQRSSTHSTWDGRTWWGCRSVAGALELFRRQSGLPMTLVLASAYAGWAGSLPAELADERLQQALRLADLPPDSLVEELIPFRLGARGAGREIRGEQATCAISTPRSASTAKCARSFGQPSADQPPP
jgi:hypothetical protein